MINVDQLSNVLAACPGGCRIIVASDGLSGGFRDIDSMDAFLGSDVIILWPTAGDVQVDRLYGELDD